MNPDLATAAKKAREIHDKFGRTMEPLCILKAMYNVQVCSFADVASKTGEARDKILAAFTEPCDAISIYSAGKYIVVYNQRMPFDIVRKALARELGHIVLGHDGTRPEEVRNEETLEFAEQLLRKE